MHPITLLKDAILLSEFRILKWEAIWIPLSSKEI